MATRMVEIFSIIINGSKLEFLNLLRCINTSNIRGHVSTFTRFHVRYILLSYTIDPRIISALPKNRLDLITVKVSTRLNLHQYVEEAGRRQH